MDTLGKTLRHYWKDCLNISKIAKFLSDLLKTNEDTPSQSHEILRTFVWWGHKLVPHHTSVCKFSQLCGAVSS